MKLRIAAFLIVPVMALSLAACGRATGWPQATRDTVIDSCSRSAKAGGSPLDDGQIKSYCTCYQQNVEKTFPDVSKLLSVTAEQAAKEGQKCLEAMVIK